MDYGTLINAVEAYKCLYDKSDKNYRNNVIKEAAWDEIAEIADMPSKFILLSKTLHM